MKNLITFLLFASFSFSTNAQCKLEVKKDQFTGVVTRATKFEFMSMYRTINGLKFKLVEFIDNQDTSMVLYLDVIQKSMRCFGPDCKILIKSGETVISLNLSGKIDCKSSTETLMDFAGLSSADVEFLKDNVINAVRVYYTEGYDDWDIKNNSDYFIRNFKCFK